MLYKEVIRFAVCLSAAPETLIEFIFTRLTPYLRYSYFDNDSIDFLRSLGTELKSKHQVNLFNNKYFNYTTKENPVCFIPSRFYMFDQYVAKSKSVQYKVTRAALKKSPVAECAIHVPTDALINALRILEEIQKRIKDRVVISSFVVLDDFATGNEPFGGFTTHNTFISKIFKRTLVLDEHMKVFGIRGFRLPQPTFRHIAQELNRCTNIELLCLREVQQNIPIKLGEALMSMSSLKYVNVQDCPLTRLSCEALLLGLTQCRYLTVLNLSDSMLSGCLDYLLGATNRPGFPFLQILILDNTKLRISDIKSIANAVRQNKLQSLIMLGLSQNILTDHFECLVPLERGDFPGFPCLQYLGLNDTNLNTANVRNLSRAIHLNKFPALEHLVLSCNCLTGFTKIWLKYREGHGFKMLKQLDLAKTDINKEDLKTIALVLSSSGFSSMSLLRLNGNDLQGIIGELFTDRGLPSIQVLDLRFAGLGKEDILHLSNAVKNGKLPELREINLQGNNVEDVENELLTLSKACSIVYGKRKITIGTPLQATCDPIAFHEKMLHLCQESEIELNFEFIHLANMIRLMSGLSHSPPSISGILMADLMF